MIFFPAVVFVPTPLVTTLMTLADVSPSGCRELAETSAAVSVLDSEEKMI
jgi:hypothetical protein